MEGLSIGARTSGQDQPGHLLELQSINTKAFESSQVKDTLLFVPWYYILEAIFISASYSGTGGSLLNGEVFPFLITMPIFDTQDFSILREEPTNLTPELGKKYRATAEQVFVANYGYLIRPSSWKSFAFSAAAGRRARQIEVDTDQRVSGQRAKGTEPSFDQHTVFKTWVGLVGLRTMPVNHVHLSFDYVAGSSPVERRTTLRDPIDVRYVKRLDPFPTRWFASLTFDWY